MGKVKVDNGLLQGLEAVCVSHAHNKCRRMTMISFSRNRGLNQSPLQTNERQLAPSPPISLPHAGPTARPQQRTSENDRKREREKPSANRQHFSFIKAKKAFLRGACRHDSHSQRKGTARNFPNTIRDKAHVNRDAA